MVMFLVFKDATVSGGDQGNFVHIFLKVTNCSYRRRRISIFHVVKFLKVLFIGVVVSSLFSVLI